MRRWLGFVWFYSKNAWSTYKLRENRLSPEYLRREQASGEESDGFIYPRGQFQQGCIAFLYSLSVNWFWPSFFHYKPIAIIFDDESNETVLKCNFDAVNLFPNPFNEWGVRDGGSRCAMGVGGGGDDKLFSVFQQVFWAIPKNSRSIDWRTDWLISYVVQTWHGNLQTSPLTVAHGRCSTVCWWEPHSTWHSR